MSVIVPPAPLLGSEVEVPCADGQLRRYVNLDYAASTPVMGAVWDVVEAFVPWYSSVHRGTGAKSQVSTAAYEHAREVVAQFAGAPDASVVFVRNTTEAVNVLATALPPRTAGSPSAASRCCTAAARSSSSRSTTSSGPTRPTASRRARPM
jgi:selenocysteine lyase/cysteine desulfurase